MAHERLIFRTSGDPSEVVEFESIPDQPVPEGQIEIEMLAAPINPSDINFIQGVYGIKPVLPSTIGFEGAGRVVSAPKDLDLPVGTMVIPLKSFHTWQQRAICRPQECIPLPQGMDPLQASMLAINPMTALHLLKDFANLEKGDWIVQNAANSGVGYSVIQLARHFGYRTINVVRREECRQPLIDAGADHVLLMNENLSSELKTILGSSGSKLCLNAVGGESAHSLSKVLAPGGHHVTFGAMSKRPVTIPNGVLIFKQAHFHGFWLTRCLEEASPESIRKDYALLAGIVQSGDLNIPVEAEYKLKDFSKALEHAMESKRQGKVLFRIRS